VASGSGGFRGRPASECGRICHGPSAPRPGRPRLGRANVVFAQINAKRGTTFLLVEQNARIALGIADYGYIMENGRIVFDGPAGKLRGNDDVREFYLGLSEAARRKSFRELKFYKRRKRWVF
jgi:hypothetical protein